MKTPGLKIEELFKLTRISVKAASNGAQTPWEETSLKRDFYFVEANHAPVMAPGNDSVVDTNAKLIVNVNTTDAVVTVNGHIAPGACFP